MGVSWEMPEQGSRQRALHGKRRWAIPEDRKEFRAGQCQVSRED